MLFWTRKSYAKSWLYYKFSALNKCDTRVEEGEGEGEDGRFSAWLGLAKLMPGHEIENVVFLGNTEIFEERKHMVFLPLPRPTYMQM